jgi:predicted DsbA family dithiol-disulfide isomerase
MLDVEEKQVLANIIRNLDLDIEVLEEDLKRLKALMTKSGDFKG